MRYQFMRFPNGLAKAFTMSYDDGCKFDPRFADRISEAGLKATFNLCTKKHSRALSDDVIREKFLDRGHEIAVHGALHRASGGLRPIEGIKDVLECRLELEERFGIIIRGMAFPDFGITRFHNGAAYDQTKQYLTELDIVYSRTLAGDNNSFRLPEDWHRWMPTAHHQNPSLFAWLDEFCSIKTDELYITQRYPRLFYLWGHSYEFDMNNNWERLDEICDKISGRDDIWYATNMEIYEYTEAYKSLVYSADGTRAYNPTLIDVWLTRDDTLYCVKSGETVKF